jgi:hypothetical protein
MEGGHDIAVALALAGVTMLAMDISIYAVGRIGGGGSAVEVSAGRSGGKAIPVPDGASGPFPTNNGKGFQYGGGAGGKGLHSEVDRVRIMDPSPQNPGGSVSYMKGGQVVDQYTGQTFPPSDPRWYIP